MSGQPDVVSLRGRRLRRALPTTFVRGVVASAAGAALLSVPARHFRVDVVASHGFVEDLPYSAVYGLALALLVAGWRLATRRPPSLRATMLAGLAVQLVALVAPPFLSLDSLCYAAIGRAMAHFHASAYVPLERSLPQGDRFFAILPDLWRHQGSAYSGGFNQLARLVALAIGDNLAAAIRAFQLVAVAAMTLAAWLVARAVGLATPAAHGDADAPARAAALVLFCPLTIIEATVNAHNDALLALAVAGWALAVAASAPRRGLGALVAAVAVKASALLLLVVEGAALAGRRLGGRVRARTLALAFAGVSAAAVFGLLFAARRVPALRLVLALVGGADEAPHCTRSVECIPRAFLFWTLHAPRAAWLVGLAFRLGGAAWLMWIGWRAARAGRGLTPAVAATALAIYYLFLHGFMQSWYLLSIVPLLPFAEPRMRRAIDVFFISALAYYMLFLPLQGDERAWVVALKELSEGLLVIIPPSLVLLRRSPPAAHALQAAA